MKLFEQTLKVRSTYFVSFRGNSRMELRLWASREVCEWILAVHHLWSWAAADIWAVAQAARCRNAVSWRTVPERHPWCSGRWSRRAVASPRRSGCRTCWGCACGTRSQWIRGCRCRPLALDCATASPLSRMTRLTHLQSTSIYPWWRSSVRTYAILA